MSTHVPRKHNRSRWHREGVGGGLCARKGGVHSPRTFVHLRRDVGLRAHHLPVVEVHQLLALGEPEVGEDDVRWIALATQQDVF